jgi:hypothetical protein
MPMFKKRNWIRVRVWSADRKRCLGLGWITSRRNITLFGVKATTPRIKLDSGKVEYGFGCWWERYSL